MHISRRVCRLLLARSSAPPSRSRSVPLLYRSLSSQKYSMSNPTEHAAEPKPAQATAEAQPAAAAAATEGGQNAQGKKKSKAKAAKLGYQLKVPKGTKDWDGKDMVLRDSIFSTITQVFKRHGAVTIDTPVFELKDVLTGKYGEDSKLIYDLADQGGESCALRYDLTVPFARYLAMNNNIEKIKRYHLAKVYRRDQPAMTKGRMREFYQCDIDIAGVYDPMIPDAECLRIVKEVFDGLGWEDKYTIKLNHRKLLDGIFEVCGVPADKIRSISSAVDKLDKLPWDAVHQEMTEQKGLDPTSASKVGEYVNLKGQRDLIAKLLSIDELAQNASAAAGLKDLSILFDYLHIFGVLERVSLDMSLARGLDYYTGVIYEVVTEGSAPAAVEGGAGEDAEAKPKSKGKGKGKKTAAPAADDDDRSDDPTIGVGSVAAGGRYDELVGMFSGRTVPCVGISFGVDRIFSITKSRLEQASKAKAAGTLRHNETEVYIMAFGSGYIEERMKVASELWAADIKADFMYKVSPRTAAQFKAADDAPFAVIFGENELKDGMVRVKPMSVPDDHPEKDGILVKREDLPAELKRRINERNQKAASSSGGLIQRLLALQV